MALIELSTVVNAPTGKVFAFINDPQRQHEWLTGLVSVEVTPGKAGHIGESWAVVYSAGGMRFKAKATVVEWEDNKKAVWELSSGMMEGKQTQVFEPVEGNSTKFMLRNELRMKGFMGIIMGPFTVVMMKRNVRRAHDNMKRICEAEA